jgi:HEAT repeat protein
LQKVFTRASDEAPDIASALVVIGTPAIPTLRTALRDGPFAVRIEAINALAKIRHIDIATIAEIASILNDKHQDLELRRACVAALQAALNVRATQGTLFKAARDPTPEIRADVAKGLMFGDYSAVRLLAELAQDKDTSVRIAALESLGPEINLPRYLETSSTIAMKALRNALGDSDQSVRITASKVLMMNLSPGEPWP